MLAIIGPLVAAAVAGLGALAAGLAVAWQRSALGRARRRARRAVQPVAQEARRIDRSLQRWRKRADPAARSFAAAQTDRRLRDVPLEALRDAGASNVRWSALEGAGYRTLKDVEGVSAPSLRRIHGVGPKSARRVASAARQVIARVRSEPTDLPEPDLEPPEARALAEAALDLLEARAAGGTAPRRVAELGDQLSAELDAVRRETSFGRWATSRWHRERSDAAIDRADALTEQSETVVVGGLLDESREGRRRIEAWRPPRERRPVQERFRDRYAECCALLESMFLRLGLRRHERILAGQGGLSAEVARRVEAYPLRVAALRATLRRYQAFGARYILAQERTILGDEMGLGKTMQALAAMVHCHEEDDRARFFVIAPAGLLINWLREIDKFTALPGYLLHGDELQANLASWVRDGGVAVTSYATLRNLDLGAALAGAQATIELCVVDEAHYAKNPAAGRTQAVRRVLDRSVRACLMSGTPMENHPREFVNLVEAVRPDEAEALHSRELELDAAAGNVRAFHQAVAKVYLRRNQEDVLSELPEKIEVEEWIELSTRERIAYRDAVRSGNFMAMRQAATVSPDDGTSAKLDHLEELLEDHRASERKVLVFSFFLGTLDALAQRFETVGTISGRVSPQDKQALCDAFQARTGHAMLLLQIQAGGHGLNLQKASAVVLMEPQMKPSTEDQAIARAHRMGQTNRVIVHRLLAKDTCDQTLLDLLAEKEALFDAYARQSLVKDASAQATESGLAKAVLEAEQARLAAAPA